MTSTPAGKGFSQAVAQMSSLASAPAGVERMLEAVRSHLGMEVAYLSEFEGNDSVFLAVDAPGFEGMIKPGDRHSLDDVYCRHILEGRLPELIRDTSDFQLSRDMPITAAVPIGSHVSVPIRLPDGRPFGMFCCLSTAANRSLNDRDLQVMRAFADLSAFEINRELLKAEETATKRRRVEGAINEGNFSVVYQPIFRLADARVVGFECLSRFTSEPRRPPDVWFGEAAEVGLGVDLECAAISLALRALPRFSQDVTLAINASPLTILSESFLDAVSVAPPKRLIVEITEHASVPDYDELIAVLAHIRRQGIMVAVDDAGSGYASLRHILKLAPDLIKLDMDITRNIDTDLARRSLAAALIGFAHDTGSEIVAEGVETADELRALRNLGAQRAQGYLLGRPMPLEQASCLSTLQVTRASDAA